MQLNTRYRSALIGMIKQMAFPNDMETEATTYRLNDDNSVLPRSSSRENLLTIDTQILDKKPTRWEAIRHFFGFAPSEPKTPEELAKERMHLNFASRWVENTRFLVAPVRAGLDWQNKVAQDGSQATQIEIEYEMEIGILVGNGCGIIMAVIMHYMTRNKYHNSLSLNPLYRNFKTLASVGVSVGQIITNFFPFPDNLTGMQKFFASIIADICSLALGFFALPYWLLKQYLSKKKLIKEVAEFDAKHIKMKDLEEKERLKKEFFAQRIANKRGNTLARVGFTDGWSKYGKATFTYGVSAGQIFGFIIALGQRALTIPKMVVAGAIAGVSAFVLSIILVPLINKLCKKYSKTKTPYFTSDDKDVRTNHIRSGITLGLALGSCIGALIGTLVLPGAGTMIGLMAGGAIGSVFVGTLGGIYGSRLLKQYHEKWRVDPNTDNAIDFTTRNCAFALGFIGAAIGVGFTFLFPLPALTGFALASAGGALGSAIGSALGWGVGAYSVKLAREKQAKEALVETLPVAVLPWTQRVASGANLASMLGLAIGFGVGFAFGGPAGALIGAMILAGIFGFIGGIVGALYQRACIRKKELEINREELNKKFSSSVSDLGLGSELEIKLENNDLSRKSTSSNTVASDLIETAPEQKLQKTISRSSTAHTLNSLSSSTDSDSSPIPRNSLSDQLYSSPLRRNSNKLLPTNFSRLINSTQSDEESEHYEYSSSNSNRISISA